MESPNPFLRSRQAWTFYGITLVLALLVAASAAWLGHAALILYMFTPAIGVLVMLSATKWPGGARGTLGRLGLSHFGWRGWVPAIVLPSALLIGGTCLMAAAGLAVLGPPSAYLSVGDAALNLLAALVIGAVLALFEEVGWRGYMLPHMIGSDPVGPLLLIGLLHGLWHLPLILMTDLYRSEGKTLLILPMFLLTLTLAEVFYGWLRIWSGSLWPVAIAHGALNTAWDFSDSITLTRTPMVQEYFGGESGGIVIAGLLILDILLIRSILRSPKISEDVIDRAR